MFDLLVDAKQEQQTWRVIRQLKAFPHLASLPLLICTAAFVLPDFLTYVREQQVTFLFKPLDTQVLSQQIHTILTQDILDTYWQSPMADASCCPINLREVTQLI